MQFTKVKDTRYKWFVREYGNKCWELDALSPVVLRERVASCIRSNIDVGYWTRCEVTERAERESLVEVMGTWKSLLSSAEAMTIDTSRPDVGDWRVDLSASNPSAEVST
jgi:hypothetical protein